MISPIILDHPRPSQKPVGEGPCGRKIAVGDRLGGVAIYDGESGAVLHTRRLSEAQNI